MSQVIAPGHLYSPALGSGIELLPDRAVLWANNTALAEATLDSDCDARAFFYGLQFAALFPFVTDWYFRSAWQGRVQISDPLGLDGSDTIFGFIQFEGQPAGDMWTMSDSDSATVKVSVPYPTGEAQPVNLPLRLRLAALVLDVVDGSKPADTWLPVSSLVARGDLAELLPVQHDAPRREMPLRLTALVTDDPDGMQYQPRRWRLEDAPDDISLRDLLCVLNVG